MLPSVLLVAALLLGPACCGPPPPAGTSHPRQTAAPPAETSPPQQTAAPTAGTAGTSGSTSSTLDQVAAELSGIYRVSARATTAEPLTELTKTLVGIQANVAAVSGRLDLVYDSQIEQKKVLVDLARRLDAIEESQRQLGTMQGTLRERQGLHQNETVGRLDSLQSALSGRVGELLQHQQRTASAASESADIQRQLDAIQAAVRLIPRIVLGRACGSDADCSSTLSDAECDGDGRCSCRDGFRQVSNTECRRHSRLSEVCMEHADCQTLASNATCPSGTCDCVRGFWNHNNTECRRVSAVNEGGACVGDQDCVSGRRLRCVSGTCSCPVKTLGDYEYRLTGGPDCTEGNVQLRRTGGPWGWVCDDSWSSYDAHVICRSLEFGSGRPTVDSTYGRGSTFYMDDVSCSGSESHLMSCSFNGWGKHDCGSREAAGVRCS